MYRCDDCGIEFYEPDKDIDYYTESHILLVCPHCHSENITKAEYKCHVCEEPMFEDKPCCPDCYNEIKLDIKLIIDRFVNNKWGEGYDVINQILEEL